MDVIRRLALDLEVLAIECDFNIQIIATIKPLKIGKEMGIGILLVLVRIPNLSSVTGVKIGACKKMINILCKTWFTKNESTDIITMDKKSFSAIFKQGI